jgi:L-glyceraldehyde 3-phosphate reductase
MLTNKYLNGIPSDSRMAEGSSLSEDLLTEQNLTHLRALNEIALSRGQSLAQMALAWIARDARVSSVLIGASSVGQLEQNIAALDNLEFSAEELAQIDNHAVEGGIDLWRGNDADLPVHLSRSAVTL